MGSLGNWRLLRGRCSFPDVAGQNSYHPRYRSRQFSAYFRSIRNPLWFSQGGSGKSRAIRILITVVVLAALTAAAAAIVHTDLEPHIAGYYMLAIFVVLLFIGVPIAPSMALIGMFGFWVLINLNVALETAGTVPFSAASNYTMTVLPLFIAMGIFAGLAGFAEKGFDMARRWTEGIKGGIIHATVIGSAFFAAATGSGAASCAVLPSLPCLKCCGWG